LVVGRRQIYSPFLTNEGNDCTNLPAASELAVRTSNGNPLHSLLPEPHINCLGSPPTFIPQHLLWFPSIKLHAKFFLISEFLPIWNFHIIIVVYEMELSNIFRTSNFCPWMLRTTRSCF
jgi:hypothetical protein